MANGRLRLLASPSLAAEVNRKLVSAGLDVSELGRSQRSLEEAFVEMTGGRTAGADSLRAAEGRPGRRGGEG